MNFQETLFPGYTIGEDAYQNIPAVCAPFGKKAAIIGGKHALAAAEEKIRRAVEGSGIEITGAYLVRRRGLGGEYRHAASPRWQRRICSSPWAAARPSTR